MKDLLITIVIMIPTVSVALFLKGDPFWHGASISAGVCTAYYIGQAVGRD